MVPSSRWSIRERRDKFELARESQSLREPCLSPALQSIQMVILFVSNRQLS
jgi:hypothetical protein